MRKVQLRSYGVGGLITTLLDLPLCEVLFLGGVFTAWIASERTKHAQIALQVPFRRSACKA
jgi:hypothetical protein